VPSQSFDRLRRVARLFIPHNRCCDGDLDYTSQPVHDGLETRWTCSRCSFCLTLWFTWPDWDDLCRIADRVGDVLQAVRDVERRLVH